MRYITAILSLFIIFFSFFWQTESFMDNWSTKIPYCKNGSDCWLKGWMDAITDIDDLETDKKASEFVQDITVYILWFIYLISVLLIIYAWFNLLTWVWDEEKAKESKKMISYVLIWILIIFLAWPIVEFIMNMLNVG